MNNLTFSKIFTQSVNKNLLAATLALATTTTMIDVAARPQYVAPTGAAGCTSCHTDNFGRGFQPGILNAAQGGLAGLKAFLHPAAPDTAPVFLPINNQWDVTVGETPLVIPLQITDKENDSFALHGSAPTGYKVSPLTITAPSNIPTINFSWKPTAIQANQNYTLTLYVQETGVGRTLTSNTVTANVHVWPARTSPTKNVQQFVLQSAQWSADKMTLSGQVIFKPNVNAAQRKAALKTLALNVMSDSGQVIGLPLKIVPNASGHWSKTLSLTATKVPCLVKLSYEGLKSARTVQLAPASCVK